VRPKNVLSRVNWTGGLDKKATMRYGNTKPDTARVSGG
jgi:hypothetical protein